MRIEINRHWGQLDDSFSYIERLLRSDPQKAFQTKNNAWSAVEILTHLFLTEYYALKYIKYKESKKIPNSSKATGHWIKNWFLKKYLKSSKKRISPKIVDPRHQPAHLTYNDINQLLADFREVRAELKEILATKDEKWLKSGMFKHPIIGRVHAAAMLSFFNEHFNRHMIQMQQAMSSSET